DYREYHTETTVHFIITLTEKGKEVIKKDGIEKALKLSSSLSTTNMVCFDAMGKIKKYSEPEQILDGFFDVRLEYYHKRKEYLVNDMTLTYERLSNQARFVLMIIEKKLIISNRKKADIVVELRKLEFRPFPVKKKPKTAGDPDQAGEGDDEEEIAELSAAGTAGDFDYLLSMPISRLTAEQVAKLLAERDAQEKELQILLEKTAQDLWRSDLDLFEHEWSRLMLASDESRRASIKKVKNMGIKMPNVAKAIKGKKSALKPELDSDGEEIYKPSTDKKPPKPRIGSQSKLDFKPAQSKDQPTAEPAENSVQASAATADEKPKTNEKNAQSATVTKKLKRAFNDSENDSGEPKRTTKSPVKRKKKEILKSSDDEDSDNFEIKVKAPSKSKTSKPMPSSSKVDNSGDVEAKTKAKASKAKTTRAPKKRELDSSEDSNSDIEVLGVDDDSSMDDDEILSKKTKLKKTTSQKVPSSAENDPKPKKVDRNEKSDSEADLGPPLRRPARSRAPAKYVIEPSSSEAEEGSEFEQD
ncbi:hypothetical protein O181_076025, partial [Austropuccinia psidii MF-1]|nr:hypothetical protein [Austropuccinia psidii MF-1]